MKQFSIFKFLLSTVILAILTVVVIKNRAKKTISKPQLTVGMMSGWAPYMVINKSGDYIGFDVDVAQEISKRVGKELVIKDMGSLAPLFLALNQNKIDLLFSGLDITTQRSKKIDMVRYTGENIKNLYLLFWNKIPAGITCLQDLAGKPNACVCVEPGSSSATFMAQERFKNITQKPVNSVVDMIMEIKYGKSLAAILEPLVVQDLQKKNPEIKTLEVKLPEDFQILGIGIGIKKNNTRMQKEVTQIVQKIKKDGTLRKFEQKWNLPSAQEIKTSGVQS